MGRMESRWKVEEWGGGEMRVKKKESTKYGADGKVLEYCTAYYW